MTTIDEVTREQQLVESNRSLVYWIVSRRYGRFHDDLREELVAEGMLRLTMAAKKFDPSLGYAFTTSAVTAIRNALNDYLRTYHTVFSIGRGSTVSRNSLPRSTDRDLDLGQILASKPEQSPHYWLELRELLDWLLPQLTEAQREIIRRRFDGQCDREIGLAMGKSRGAINRQYMLALRHMRVLIRDRGLL